MINKIGHLCWFGPHRPPQEMIDSWSIMNPGVIWTLWKDHTQGWEFNQEQIRVRAARNEFNGVCDVIRYELLYRFGGVCVDADSTAVKPLADGDFFENDCAIASYESEAVRPGMIACGFLGAPKGHPFFKACIEEVGKQDPSEQAWKAVGPILMGRMAAKMPDQIRVYPSRHFCPVHYTGTPAPGDHIIFAEQGWGSTKGYNGLRRLPCQCSLCWNSMLRAPWM